MRDNKPTLYIGAHPDDTFIGCAISIKRNAQNAQVITTNTGVIQNRKYPIITGGITLQNEQEYTRTRLEEDKKAMQALGINTNTQYTNLQLPDLQTHLNIDKLIDTIENIVKSSGIERIVTHEIPQSHPDHEVVCFCAHYVRQKLGLEVWEYPMYGFDNQGGEINREFLSIGHDPVIIVDFSEDETTARTELIRTYQTQDYIEKKFRGKNETFGRINRDFTKNIPTMKYLRFFYQHSDSVPTPEEVRNTIKEFLSQNEI